MITLLDLLKLAYDHAERTHNDSARLCYADAYTLGEKGDLESARRRALDSLKHSVGICHADYALATAEQFQCYDKRTGEVVRGEPMTYEAAVLWANRAPFSRSYPVSYGVQPYSAQVGPNEHPNSYH